MFLLKNSCVVSRKSASEPSTYCIAIKNSNMNSVNIKTIYKKLIKLMTKKSKDPKKKCFLCGATENLITKENSFALDLCELCKEIVRCAHTSSSDFNKIVIGKDCTEKGIILSDRTFGVELECINNASMNRYIASTIIGTGSHAYGIDGSIRDTVADRDYWATEVRTQPMCALEGEQEFTSLCNMLIETRHKTNVSCGTHCHIGVPEAREKTTSDEVEGKLKNLLLFYRVFEPAIRSLLPKCRRNNGYCQSLTTGLDSIMKINNATKKPAGIFKDHNRFDRIWYNQSIQYGITVEDLKASGSQPFGRYGINLCSLYEHGTVEIRYHEGTLDAERLLHWIAFHAGIIDIVMDGLIDEETILSYLNPRNAKALFVDLVGMLYANGNIGESTLKYLTKRFNSYKTLNKGEVTNKQVENNAANSLVEEPEVGETNELVELPEFDDDNDAEWMDEDDDSDIWEPVEPEPVSTLSEAQPKPERITEEVPNEEDYY